MFYCMNGCLVGKIHLELMKFTLRIRVQFALDLFAFDLTSFFFNSSCNNYEEYFFLETQCLYPEKDTNCLFRSSAHDS